jgi:hypothetical protein
VESMVERCRYIRSMGVTILFIRNVNKVENVTIVHVGFQGSLRSKSKSGNEDFSGSFGFVDATGTSQVQALEDRRSN